MADAENVAVSPEEVTVVEATNVGAEEAQAPEVPQMDPRDVSARLDLVRGGLSEAFDRFNMIISAATEQLVGLANQTQNLVQDVSNRLDAQEAAMRELVGASARTESAPAPVVNTGEIVGQVTASFGEQFAEVRSALEAQNTRFDEFSAEVRTSFTGVRDAGAQQMAPVVEQLVGSAQETVNKVDALITRVDAIETKVSMPSEASVETVVTPNTRRKGGSTPATEEATTTATEA